ncbi:MAG: GH25 family lysozyme [Bacteroidota bacterium]|nr:GH25 family lysozyme [Bacteroidota bacterium]
MRNFLFLTFCVSVASCNPKKPTEASATLPVKDTVINNVKPVIVVDTSPVFGIDIAKYQGDLTTEIGPEDKLDFIICKATEGETYTDPDFENNWKTIKTKGLIRGSYHFYRSNDDPAKQAQFFVQTLKGLDSMDLPPILDIEGGSLVGAVDPKNLQKDLLAFLKEVEKLCKKKPIIYSGLSFSNKYLISEELAVYDLWLAEYNGKEKPRVPDNWKDKGYLMWQKTDHYNIESDTTDFDIFSGNKVNFLNYIRTH